MTERSNARAKAAREAGKDRVDDNPKTIAKRVKGFREKNASVERHLRRREFKTVSKLHEVR